MKLDYELDQIKSKNFKNKKNFKYYLTIGFGIGKLKYSGTVASLIATFLWWIIVYFINFTTYYIFLFFLIIFGIYLCQFTNKIIKIHDDKKIVWDEFTGMWISLITISEINLKSILCCFFLFRIFDILKPWPIYWMHRYFKNGFGIMIDDIIAGIFSFIIFKFFIYSNI